MTKQDKKYKVVQVGCGNMAKSWVRYAQTREEIEIVALVDINLDAAEAFANEFGLRGAKSYTGLEQAIRDSGANLVFDVTIPAAHKQVVATAVRLGCDIFGEKPMAESMADAVEMKRIVEGSGRSYSVMQNRRYTKQIREARGMIEQNVIGQPGFATANFFLGPHFGGFREMMDSPLLLDMAIHTFDQARFLLGADPVSVYCQEFNPRHSWYKGNAAAVCIFEFSDGSIFSYNGAWCAEGAPTSWHGDWRIAGSKGTLIWDGTNEPYCEVVPEDTEQGKFLHTYTKVAPELQWPGREGHDGCFDEMLEALKEGRKAETDCSDNLKSMAMVFGAIQSARQGTKVMINSLMD